MIYTEIPENLEKLNTPIIICNEEGLVIYKNTAAVRSVRLPRRNTSMLTHLGQTERGELAKLSERKRPSVLTVQTGDRNARALVTTYTRDGRTCSLWVFISLLQTGAVSGMFAELDATFAVIGRDICEYIKSVDEFSRVPDRPTAAKLEKLDERLRRIITAMTEQKRGWLYDLGDTLDMLHEAIEPALRNHGYYLHIEEDFDRVPAWSIRKGEARVLIDLHAFYALYLHLILFCCECTPMRHIDMKFWKEKGQENDEYYMELAFTLPYPPFYTEGDGYSTDLSALIALSPRNRFELQLFEAYSTLRGFHMSYQITHEAVNNMKIRMKVPVLIKVRLRSGEESNTEQLFVKHDLALYFWHMVGERLRMMGNE